MAVRRSRAGHIFGIRIPFFRIFYSTTYTTFYIICICFLAITPISMMWRGIEQRALQYVVMIGGTCVLTASFAIFIFASRLFTNRTVRAGVGKAYIPVEPGEVGRGVRKMIVNQFERSAMIAWESRPRDLLGEILRAEQLGVLPPETSGVSRNDYTVGREIPVDPAHPPWGEVWHAGWSSPAHKEGNEVPHLQFAPLVEELPNLIESRAVSLAPPDPSAIPTDAARPPDPVVYEILRRPDTMGLRHYLTQLSYLGLVNPPEVGQSFLHQYENARFGGLPISEAQFRKLMSTFGELFAGMESLVPEIIDLIRTQTGNKATTMELAEQSPNGHMNSRRQLSSSPPRTPDSSIISPVTARTAPSRNLTPYLQLAGSEDSFESVIHERQVDEISPSSETRGRPSQDSSSLESGSGSAVRHRSSPDNG